TFELLSRSLFDDQFQFSRSETVLRYTGPRLDVATRFTWLEEDIEAGRPIDTSEWTMDAALDITPAWTGRANWRYDFVTDDATRAGVGVTYRTECVTVDFDVERRFTSNDLLEPSTRFGFGIELVGFGADERGQRSRRCGI
ncbi:MAG: LPS-assembly protein LptD, partial [Pseudomonadota bacterium]